jgi:GMP synthase-like glutamine amidotransferase
MIRFLAVQHSFSEFLGAFEPELEARDIGFTYLRPVTGQDVFANARQFDSLWLLGGAWPVDDAEHCPWVADEVRLVQAFERAGRPVVGLGFGAHVVALAHGAAPQPAAGHIARWTTAHATDAGRDDPVARAIDGRRVLAMVNGDVSAPAGAAPVAVDAEGAWLVLRPGERTYALRCRPELKPGMIEDMIMEDDRPVAETVGALLEEARRNWIDSQETTRRVAAALVSALGLMDESRKARTIMLRSVGEGG